MKDFRISSSAGVHGLPDQNSAGFILQEPDYRDRLSAGSLRRMGKGLRMGVWSALECGATDTDPLFIGTGLGGLTDSEKFLLSLAPGADGQPRSVVSPTPFILSTHNALGGQVAMALDNHQSNVTHVQNGLSFEEALKDALLAMTEGKEHVVVGAVDEHIELLDKVGQGTGAQPSTLNLLGEGATFFRLAQGEGAVRIVQCKTFHRPIVDVESYWEDVELVLFGRSDLFSETAIAFPEGLCYSDECGRYMTNSAFGLYRGMQEIEEGRASTVAVLNSYGPNCHGLILLEKP